MVVQELVSGEVDACRPDVSVAEAAQRMMTDDVGSLAVVHDGELVGIFTERDVLRAVSEDLDPRTSKVSEVMTPDPDSLSPEISVEDAASWMMAAGYRHLPVIADGDLIGMVSIKDLMWAMLEERQVPPA
jgi:CBS domain-containing protein